MTWPVVFIVTGVVVTLALWVTFVYIAVRGLKTEIPDARFGALLDGQETAEPAAMKILLPVDGSAASVAAIQEVARCPLPSGSTVELLYAIHSRLPVIPDFPPWAVTIAAAHGESIREQTLHAPEVLAAAAKHLQAHQRSLTIVTKTVDGVPKDEILREAVALGADRIVLGSHGRGRGPARDSWLDGRGGGSGSEVYGPCCATTPGRSRIISQIPRRVSRPLRFRLPPPQSLVEVA